MIDILVNAYCGISHEAKLYRKTNTLLFEENDS